MVVGKSSLLQYLADPAVEEKNGLDPTKYIFAYFDFLGYPTLTSTVLWHRLLADMHRTVCKSYGLYFDALNCAKRATVIVDKEGKVAYAKVQEIKTPRDDKEILEALKKLN